MSTRKSEKPRPQPPSFFDKYAGEYDLMTAASLREPNHRREVQSLMERFHPASVLDAGCATGLTCRLFAQEGAQVVGLDRSPAMLEQARRNAEEKRLPIEFVEGQFEALPRTFDGKFDLVVCLANSIAGVSTKPALSRALNGFRRALAPGGAIVLQMLNYAAVPEGEVRPIRVTEHNGLLYARFQERDGSRMVLHALRIDRNQDPASMEVFSYRSDNFSPGQMTAAVKAAGFGRVSRYGNLFLTEPFRPNSRDLVIIAHRPLR